MDAQTRQHQKTLHINHFSPDKVPWRRMGQYLYRVIEDGNNTQQRLSMIESLVPPKAAGPVMHFHEMHDEGFIVTKGTVRFHSPGRPAVDAKAGDVLTVPVRCPHKFSNPFDEEATFINTNTPGFYVRYFEHLEYLTSEKMELTKEVNAKAMERFGTMPLTDEDVQMLELENSN